MHKVDGMTWYTLNCEGWYKKYKKNPVIACCSMCHTY